MKHAGSVRRCYICNLHKPIPAIEDTQHNIPPLPLDV